MADQTSWNYYFVKCASSTLWTSKKCPDVVDRGVKMRTNVCERHLEKKHSDLLKKRNEVLLKKKGKSFEPGSKAAKSSI
jgi:hypothetical protein